MYLYLSLTKRFNVWSLIISVSVEDSVVVINKLAEDEVKEEVQFKRKRTCSIGQLVYLALFIVPQDKTKVTKKKKKKKTKGKKEVRTHALKYLPVC